MDSALWKKAEELFVQCADMNPTQASAFLDASCTDSVVREAVDNLLSGDAQDDEREQTVGRVASTLAAGEKDPWIGTEVGAYTVTSRIAEGGMGVVYRASRSDQQFEQDVAIKFLTGTVATDELRARFIAERQILANLNHNNIAKLLDGGETQAGVPFLVMEYIDGVPVDDYCAANRLTIDQRIALFLQICSAVDYAHGNLIVHRDIKPSNILVAQDGVPKLLDFGIAKILDTGNQPPGAALTMVGSQLMTPRHASPEQMLGQQITTASDVYSLGLLLYELLCGRFPYDLDNTTRASEIENTIVRTDPLAPSAQVQATADVDALCRERHTEHTKLQQRLRGDLDTIVLTALRKEPELRYHGAREFADDLRRAAEHRPILARPPTLPYLASRYWHRHKVAAVGIVATVLVTIAGVTASTVGFFQARAAERMAVEEARNAAATSDFLVSLFRASDPNETAGNELSVTDVLHLGVERIESDMDATPLVKLSILETLSSVYKARFDIDKAVLLLERALHIDASQVPADPVRSSRLNSDLGDLYRKTGRYDDAARHVEQAKAINSASGNDTDAAHASVLNNLALIYGATGRTDEVAALFTQALRLRKNVYGSPHPMVALTLHNIAWHYQVVGRPDDAEPYAVQALQMRIALFGEVHPRVASTMGRLSQIYFEQARWVEAEATAMRSLAITEQIFEPGHRSIAYEMFFVAQARHAKGDLRSAADLFSQAISYAKQLPESGQRSVANRQVSYVRCLLDLGEYKRAEAELREALAIYARYADLSVKGRETATTLLAHTFLLSGRLDDAAELLSTGNVTQDSPERRLLRARLLLAQGDAARAEQLTSALLQELENTAEHNLPLLPQILHVQGRAQIAAGRAAAAVDVLNKALSIYAQWWGDDYWRADLVGVDLGSALMQNGKPAQGRSQLAKSAAGLKAILGAAHPDTLRADGLLAQLEVSK